MRLEMVERDGTLRISRQMARHLRREGVVVGRRRVRRLMRLMGLEAIYRKPRTSVAQRDHHVYPYLLGSLTIDRPDQVWCADITYIPLSAGFLYLVAVMDWASRHVLAWRLSNTMDTGFCVMTDAEINEMPRVWIVGGDGGMGDIGYQNVSKMILQNRPNVKAVMLDTQVYSNTGGQNSDSTPMLGGGDMNAFGAASQGKCVEKKTVAETFLAGHGSPFVAQVSIANAPKLFRSILDALEYRGTAFLQCFTTCQPEHGVGDDMALDQAQRVRDSRGAPEFVFNPRLGETYQEGARSGAPCLRSRLRRLHQDAPGEGRQAGSDEDLAAVGPLLRGAPQGVAPAAEQGGDREHRVPCPAHTARGGGLGHAVEGGALRPRRGASRGTDPRPRRREDGLASVRGCAGQPPATRHRAGLP